MRAHTRRLAGKRRGRAALRCPRGELTGDAEVGKRRAAAFQHRDPLLRRALARAAGGDNGEEGAGGAGGVEHITKSVLCDGVDSSGDGGAADGRISASSSSAVFDSGARRGGEAKEGGGVGATEGADRADCGGEHLNAVTHLSRQRGPQQRGRARRDPRGVGNNKVYQTGREVAEGGLVEVQWRREERRRRRKWGRLADTKPLKSGVNSSLGNLLRGAIGIRCDQSVGAELRKLRKVRKARGGRDGAVKHILNARNR